MHTYITSYGKYKYNFEEFSEICYKLIENLTLEFKWFNEFYNKKNTLKKITFSDVNKLVQIFHHLTFNKFKRQVNQFSKKSIKTGKVNSRNIKNKLRRIYSLLVEKSKPVDFKPFKFKPYTKISKIVEELINFITAYYIPQISPDMKEYLKNLIERNNTLREKYEKEEKPKIVENVKNNLKKINDTFNKNLDKSNAKSKPANASAPQRSCKKSNKKSKGVQPFDANLLDEGYYNRDDSEFSESDDFSDDDYELISTDNTDNASDACLMLIDHVGNYKKFLDCLINAQRIYNPGVDFAYVTFEEKPYEQVDIETDETYKNFEKKKNRPIVERVKYLVHSDEDLQKKLLSFYKNCSFPCKIHANYNFILQTINSLAQIDDMDDVEEDGASAYGSGSEAVNYVYRAAWSDKTCTLSSTNDVVYSKYNENEFLSEQYRTIDEITSNNINDCHSGTIYVALYAVELISYNIPTTGALPKLNEEFKNALKEQFKGCQKSVHLCTEIDDDLCMFKALVYFRNDNNLDPITGEPVKLPPASLSGPNGSKPIKDETRAHRIATKLWCQFYKKNEWVKTRFDYNEEIDKFCHFFKVNVYKFEVNSSNNNNKNRSYKLLDAKEFDYEYTMHVISQTFVTSRTLRTEVAKRNLKKEAKDATSLAEIQEVIDNACNNSKIDTYAKDVGVNSYEHIMNVKNIENLSPIIVCPYCKITNYVNNKNNRRNLYAHMKKCSGEIEQYLNDNPNTPYCPAYFNNLLYVYCIVYKIEYTPLKHYMVYDFETCETTCSNDYDIKGTLEGTTKEAYLTEFSVALGVKSDVNPQNYYYCLYERHYNFNRNKPIDEYFVNKSEVTLDKYLNKNIPFVKNEDFVRDFLNDMKGYSYNVFKANFTDFLTNVFNQYFIYMNNNVSNKDQCFVSSIKFMIELFENNKFMQTLINHCRQVMVYGWNSESFDTNFILPYLDSKKGIHYNILSTGSSNKQIEISSEKEFDIREIINDFYLSIYEKYEQTPEKYNLPEDLCHQKVNDKGETIYKNKIGYDICSFKVKPSVVLRDAMKLISSCDLRTAAKTYGSSSRAGCETANNISNVKGQFPYAKINSTNLIENLLRTTPFEQRDFYNSLSRKDLSDEDYNTYLEDFKSCIDFYDYTKKYNSQDINVMYPIIDTLIEKNWEDHIDTLTMLSISAISGADKYLSCYKDFDWELGRYCNKDCYVLENTEEKLGYSLNFETEYTYKENIERYKEFVKSNAFDKFVLTEGHWASKVRNYKYQDEKANRDTENNVTEEDYEYYASEFKNGLCYYCNCSFSKDNKPTLDRIDNTKGHSKENCRIACEYCNKYCSNRDPLICKFFIQLRNYALKNNLPFLIQHKDTIQFLRNGITGGLSIVGHRKAIANESTITRLLYHPSSMIENIPGKVEVFDTKNKQTHIIGLDFNSLYPSVNSGNEHPCNPYTGHRMYMPGYVKAHFKVNSEKQYNYARRIIFNQDRFSEDPKVIEKVDLFVVRIKAHIPQTHMQKALFFLPIIRKLNILMDPAIIGSHMYQYLEKNYPELYNKQNKFVEKLTQTFSTHPYTYYEKNSFNEHFEESYNNLLTNVEEFLPKQDEYMTFSSYYLWFLIDEFGLVIEDIREICIFNKHLAFGEFFNKKMNRRQEAILNGDKVGDATNKVSMNSSYGGDALNSQRFKSARIVNATEAAKSHRNPYHCSTTKLNDSSYLVIEKKKSYAMKTPLQCSVFTLDNAKYWYLNFIYNFLYKALDLNRIAFFEGDTDSMYFIIAGNPNDSYKQGFKYIIKNEKFYNENVFKWLPYNFYATDDTYRPNPQTPLDQMHNKKRFLAASVEHESVSGIAVSSKLYCMFGDDQDKFKPQSFATKGVSLNKNPQISVDSYLDCINNQTTIVGYNYSLELKTDATTSEMIKAPQHVLDHIEQLKINYELLKKEFSNYCKKYNDEITSNVIKSNYSDNDIINLNIDICNTELVTKYEHCDDDEDEKIIKKYRKYQKLLIELQSEIDKISHKYNALKTKLDELKRFNKLCLEEYKKFKKESDPELVQNVTSLKEIEEEYVKDVNLDISEEEICNKLRIYKPVNEFEFEEVRDEFVKNDPEYQQLYNKYVELTKKLNEINNPSDEMLQKYIDDSKIIDIHPYYNTQSIFTSEDFFKEKSRFEERNREYYQDTLQKYNNYIKYMTKTYGSEYNFESMSNEELRITHSNLALDVGSTLACNFIEKPDEKDYMDRDMDLFDNILNYFRRRLQNKSLHLLPELTSEIDQELSQINTKILKLKSNLEDKFNKWHKPIDINDIDDELENYNEFIETYKRQLKMELVRNAKDIPESEKSELQLRCGAQALEVKRKKDFLYKKEALKQRCIDLKNEYKKWYKLYKQCKYYCYTTNKVKKFFRIKVQKTAISYLYFKLAVVPDNCQTCVPLYLPCNNIISDLKIDDSYDYISTNPNIKHNDYFINYIHETESKIDFLHGFNVKRFNLNNDDLDEVGSMFSNISNLPEYKKYIATYYNKFSTKSKIPEFIDLYCYNHKKVPKELYDITGLVMDVNKSPYVVIDFDINKSLSNEKRKEVREYIIEKYNMKKYVVTTSGGIHYYTTAFCNCPNWYDARNIGCYSEYDTNGVLLYDIDLMVPHYEKSLNKDGVTSGIVLPGTYAHNKLGEVGQYKTEGDLKAKLEDFEKFHERFLKLNGCYMVQYGIKEESPLKPNRDLIKSVDKKVNSDTESDEVSEIAKKVDQEVNFDNIRKLATVEIHCNDKSKNKDSHIPNMFVICGWLSYYSDESLLQIQNILCNHESKLTSKSQMKVMELVSNPVKFRGKPGDKFYHKISNTKGNEKIAKIVRYC